MAKPIIISGIPAGDSGVGRLIEYLISENHNCFEFIKGVGDNEIY
ncbi:hypothetical protein [Halanaerobium sp.]|nr:hypothetical protein [Halanaerobium sp.]PUU88930.1 MAG: hypothetical protein CI949_2913 [Halanaerobium sp.]